jgi:hypothetical protein
LSARLRARRWKKVFAVASSMSWSDSCARKLKRHQAFGPPQ